MRLHTGEDGTVTPQKIESVDFFYLAMPEVTTAADGSQDALVVRVRAGEHEGWGECEAAPLPSIAAFVCPMSHGACRSVSDAVLGAKIETPDDMRGRPRRDRRGNGPTLPATWRRSAWPPPDWPRPCPRAAIDTTPAARTRASGGERCGAPEMSAAGLRLARRRLSRPQCSFERRIS